MMMQKPRLFNSVAEDPIACGVRWVACSNCGHDIRCLSGGASPSLVECKCPRCGLVDVYPGSRLLENQPPPRTR
jgi:hypothetical protein